MFLDVLFMLELCSMEWQMKRSVKPKGASFFQHKVALLLMFELLHCWYIHHYTNHCTFM